MPAKNAETTRTLSPNAKATLGMLAAALAVVLGLVVVNQFGGSGSEADPTVLVRSDSHRLSTAPEGAPVVVEFLDFECESCGAAYPAVEKLRAEYGDRLTYVVRYFPIASHPNAFNAAHAAEAAARQGKFEQMYQKLFDNQTTWGHQQQSQATVFEGYAADLGLDLARFRADVGSEDVAARVKKDAADGQTLGVQGTPTFFIDATRYEDAATYDGLKAAIDDASKR